MCSDRLLPPHALMLRVSLRRLCALCLLQLTAGERATQEANPDAGDGVGVRATGAFEAIRHRKSLPEVGRHILPEATSLMQAGTAADDAKSRPMPERDEETNELTPEETHNEDAHKEETAGAGAGYLVPAEKQSKANVQYKTQTLEEKKDHDSAAFHSWAHGSEDKTPLKISGIYGPTIADLRKQEHLLFNDDFKVDELRKQGSSSFTANKIYHDALEQYIAELYRMSHGAQKATKQEFDQQTATANALGHEVHKGNMDANFKTELNQKKGHVTEEQHAALSDSKHVDSLDSFNKGGGHPKGGN